jgi:hypothetical protein
MVWLRKALLLIAGLVIVVLAPGAHYYCKEWRHASGFRAHVAATNRNNPEAEKLSRRLNELKAFAAAHGYNTRIAFLADMQLPSGRDRFFICDMSGDSILQAGLVAHGSGNKPFSPNPVFSNTDGSGCSSLGKYRVGQPYTGRFGTAYTLYGLDKTNDQALRRHVVLHAYDCIPEKETDPYPICNSLGCAMVSPGFLQELRPVIDGSRRPILLWIFD